ncbi:MAG: hypothetical protein CMJ83_22575 [Planctomycetes bacterium]|nr:hypothetical protein [Planctomycetota bacterium]
MCRTILGSVALLLLMAAWAPGQQEPESQKAPPTPELDAAIQDEIARVDRAYVITATRRAERLFDLPYSGSVSDAATQSRSRTVQDTLRETPGVQLQRTSYAQTSPFLRGLTGYHTLMMIDGIRLNNSVLRSGPNEYWGLIDALSLDRIETVLGPASVLYGSDAVGGSVNAIPVRRRQYGESSWSRRLSFRFSEAENSVTARAQLSGNVGDTFGFVIGGTASSFGDLNAGGDLGRQPHLGYHNGFADVALDLHLDESWSLRLLGQLARVDDASRSHRTVFGVSYHGTTVGTDRRRNFDWERDLLALVLEGVDLDGFFDAMRFRVSYQRVEEERDRVRGDGRRDRGGFEVDTLGFGVELSKDTEIGRLTTGADWYHDFVDSFRDDFDALGAFTGSAIQGPVGDDASYDLVGVFLQNEVELTDGLDLIVGGRFTFAAAEADSVEDPNTGARISLADDWVSAVGSLRLLWSPIEELRLFGGVSQAFRAPNLSDLSRFDGARTNEIEVPSPGLEPEDFVSFEIGARARFGGLTGSVSYYYTLIDDLIVRQPTGAMIGTDLVVRKRNGGDGHVQGIDLGLRYDLDDNWSFLGNFQWVDGQAETFPTSMPIRATEALSRLTPINATLGVRWQTTDGRFWVRGWVVIVDAQDRVNTRDARDTSRIPPGGTPGYTTWNLEAGFNINQDMRVFAAVENLTDKNYRVHGSGVQEPGINLIVGCDVTF